MQDRDRISQWLRWRRILRWSALSLLILILLSVILDHTGAFGFTGSDQQRFDHKPVTVTRAIDGGTICVRTVDGTETTVHLLGVDAPDLPASHWSDRAAKYTAA